MRECYAYTLGRDVVRSSNNPECHRGMKEKGKLFVFRKRRAGLEG